MPGEVHAQQRVVIVSREFGASGVNEHFDEAIHVNPANAQLFHAYAFGDITSLNDSITAMLLLSRSFIGHSLSPLLVSM